MTRHVGSLALALMISTTAHAQTGKLTELARSDLAGTNMEIVVNLFEQPPGGVGALHTHPGTEVYYVIDGGTAETPDGKPIELEPNTAQIVERDIPHGGLKITGNKTLKLLTIHIIDKGKPMTVLVKP